ncbi:hypothetical protein HDU96_001050 [Phlyctochytrium bullatum]|nr:hypothetical protein HDU96_001050 [Phlyctochytrium bullatum]
MREWRNLGGPPMDTGVVFEDIYDGKALHPIEPTNHIIPAIAVFGLLWILTMIITAAITHRQRSRILKQISELRSKMWNLPPGGKLKDYHLYDPAREQDDSATSDAAVSFVSRPDAGVEEGPQQSSRDPLPARSPAAADQPDASAPTGPSAMARTASEDADSKPGVPALLSKHSSTPSTLSDAPTSTDPLAAPPTPATGGGALGGTTVPSLPRTSATIIIPGGSQQGIRVLVDDSQEIINDAPAAIGLPPLPLPTQPGATPQMELPVEVVTTHDSGIVSLEMGDLSGEKASLRKVSLASGTQSLTRKGDTGETLDPVDEEKRMLALKARAAEEPITTGDDFAGPESPLRTEITIPHFVNIPTLLLVASCQPRHPHLWPRHFRPTRTRFPDSQIIVADNFPGTAPERRLFASPQSNPLGSRVHQLILAAVEADLRLLESKFGSIQVQLPPAVWAFLGFQLLAASVFIVGSSQPWEEGLAVLLTVAAIALGILVLVLVIVRDSLTDVKAELAVLQLTLCRIESSAPYTLDFSVARAVVDMDWADWSCGFLFGGFLVIEWLVSLLSRRIRRASGGPTALEKITVNLNPHIFDPSACARARAARVRAEGLASPSDPEHLSSMPRRAGRVRGGAGSTTHDDDDDNSTIDDAEPLYEVAIVDRSEMARAARFGLNPSLHETNTMTSTAVRDPVALHQGPHSINAGASSETLADSPVRSPSHELSWLERLPVELLTRILRKVRDDPDDGTPTAVLKPRPPIGSRGVDDALEAEAERQAREYDEEERREELRLEEAMATDLLNLQSYNLRFRHRGGGAGGVGGGSVGSVGGGVGGGGGGGATGGGMGPGSVGGPASRLLPCLKASKALFRAAVGLVWETPRIGPLADVKAWRMFLDVVVGSRFSECARARAADEVEDAGVKGVLVGKDWPGATWDYASEILNVEDVWLFVGGEDELDEEEVVEEIQSESDDEDEIPVSGVDESHSESLISPPTVVDEEQEPVENKEHVELSATSDTLKPHPLDRNDSKWSADDGVGGESLLPGPNPIDASTNVIPNTPSDIPLELELPVTPRPSPTFPSSKPESPVPDSPDPSVVARPLLNPQLPLPGIPSSMPSTPPQAPQFGAFGDAGFAFTFGVQTHVPLPPIKTGNSASEGDVEEHVDEGGEIVEKLKEDAREDGDEEIDRERGKTLARIYGKMLGAGAGGESDIARNESDDKKKDIKEEERENKEEKFEEVKVVDVEKKEIVEIAELESTEAEEATQQHVSVETKKPPKLQEQVSASTPAPPARRARSPKKPRPAKFSRTSHVLPSSLPHLDQHDRDSLHYGLTLLLTHCRNLRHLRLHLPVPSLASLPLERRLRTSLRSLDVFQKVTESGLKALFGGLEEEEGKDGKEAKDAKKEVVTPARPSSATVSRIPRPVGSTTLRKPPTPSTTPKAPPITTQTNPTSPPPPVDLPLTRLILRKPEFSSQALLATLQGLFPHLRVLCLPSAPPPSSGSSSTPFGSGLLSSSLAASRMAHSRFVRAPPPCPTHSAAAALLRAPPRRAAALPRAPPPMTLQAHLRTLDLSCLRADPEAAGYADTGARPAGIPAASSYGHELLRAVGGCVHLEHLVVGLCPRAGIDLRSIGWVALPGLWKSLRVLVVRPLGGGGGGGGGGLGGMSGGGGGAVGDSTVDDEDVVRLLVPMVERAAVERTGEGLAGSEELWKMARDAGGDADGARTGHGLSPAHRLALVRDGWPPAEAGGDALDLWDGRFGVDDSVVMAANGGSRNKGGTSAGDPVEHAASRLARAMGEGRWDRLQQRLERCREAEAERRKGFWGPTQTRPSEDSDGDGQVLEASREGSGICQTALEARKRKEEREDERGVLRMRLVVLEGLDFVGGGRGGLRFYFGLMGDPWRVDAMISRWEEMYGGACELAVKCPR